MMQVSHWEHESFFKDIDLVVVGSGIVGLNIAREVKLLRPKWNILILERGFLPYGASTRNAGFACFGSASELLNDLSISSPSAVFGLVAKRYNGLSKLRSVLKDPNIDYQGNNGYEIFTAEQNDLFTLCSNQLDSLNQSIENETGLINTFEVRDDLIETFGLKGVDHLILNQYEGQIDTGKMMLSLMHNVRMSGVNLLNGIAVSGLEKTSNSYSIRTNYGFDIRTKAIVAATNAFACELLPELSVSPGRAQVLITQPLNDLKIKGCFHLDQGYYYFRNIGDRILLGGGRNIDFKGEETTEFGTTSKIQNKLNDLLKEVILPHQSFNVERRWSGIMGLGETKQPIVKRIDYGLYCAVRMGGMGIAIGALIGEETAQMICSDF